MRQAAMTAESDLSGTCWMRDSSFLWIDSLATYDAGMSILAGASTFFAFRLASCGIRRRITTKQAYLKDCENIFFNPVRDIKLQFVKVTVCQLPVRRNRSGTGLLIMSSKSRQISRQSFFYRVEFRTERQRKQDLKQVSVSLK
jgi:hypothetical protein